MSTYLIVDSALCGGVFITNFGFLIFLAFRLFPPGELIRTLASENKKPDHIEYDRVSFYIRCTVINSLLELITKVMWFDDRHKIQDKLSCWIHYNGSIFKINPLSLLITLNSQFPSV